MKNPPLIGTERLILRPPVSQLTAGSMFSVIEKKLHAGLAHWGRGIRKVGLAAKWAEAYIQTLGARSGGKAEAVAGAAGPAGLVPLRTWPSRRQVPPSATKWGPEESSRDLPRLCRSRQNRELYGLQGLRRGGGRSPQSARQR